MAPESQRIQPKLVRRGCWGDKSQAQTENDQQLSLKPTLVKERARSTVKDRNPSSTFTRQGRTHRQVNQDSNNMSFYIKGVDKYKSVSQFISGSKTQMEPAYNTEIKNYKSLNKKEQEIVNTLGEYSSVTKLESAQQRQSNMKMHKQLMVRCKDLKTER